MAMQDSGSCLSMKNKIEFFELELERLRQVKLEKEQKDLQQQELLAQEQLQNRLAQPQLPDQHRDSCNMVVGEGDGNSGYRRVKTIVCNLKDWVSKVVCCCDIVVRGRLKIGRVRLVVVVAAAIAFLLYENQIYSNTFGMLTTKTQLGALVQKNWVFHALVAVVTLVLVGLFGVCMLMWTIRWMLKVLWGYDEANQGDSSDSSDSSDLI